MSEVEAIGEGPLENRWEHVKRDQLDAARVGTQSDGDIRRQLESLLVISSLQYAPAPPNWLARSGEPAHVDGSRGFHQFG